MKLRLISMAFALSLLPMTANSQTIINMQAFSCAQYLAMQPAMSRDFSAWISGWFSYQTRRTAVDIVAHQQNIVNLKAWCTGHPAVSVLDALNAVIPQ